MPVAKTSTSVLFVCLGNICRSPLAEGIFSSLVEERGLQGEFEIASVGTAAYHVGEPADPRSIAIADEHGVALTGLARHIHISDFDEFDVIVAMDRANVSSLEQLRSGRDTSARLVMMRDFDPEGPGGDVPDPYYGGPDGFDQVYTMLARCCIRLLDRLSED